MTGRRLSLGWALLLVTVLGSVQACSSLPRIVILHDPLTPQEHVTLGESYQARGRGDLAAREFEAALRRQAEFVPALIGLGNLAYEANAFEEAEGFYRRVLTASPEHPAASNNLALVHLARGERLDEAERMTRNAAAQGGAIRPYALDTLARIYTRQGRYREAARALEEAAVLAPAENTDVLDQLRRLQHELAGVHASYE